MAKKSSDVKVSYSKKDTVPALLSFIPSILGADTTIDRATIEVGGKKYEGSGSSRQKAFENAMKKAMDDR